MSSLRVSDCEDGCPRGGAAARGDSSGPRPTRTPAPITDARSSDRPLVVVQPVEARGEQRVDGRRDRDARQVAASAPLAVLRAQAGRRPSSIRRISSTNSGLPSAASHDARVGRRRRAGRRPTRLSTSSLVSASVERLEEDDRGVRLAADPARRVVEQLRPGQADDAAPERSRSSRRGTRSGRGTSARPSGCRRTRRPAAARAARLSSSVRTAQKVSWIRGRRRRRPSSADEPLDDQSPSVVGRRAAPASFAARLRGRVRRRDARGARAAARRPART